MKNKGLNTLDTANIQTFGIKRKFKKEAFQEGEEQMEYEAAQVLRVSGKDLWSGRQAKHGLGSHNYCRQGHQDGPRTWR